MLDHLNLVKEYLNLKKKNPEKQKKNKTQKQPPQQKMNNQSKKNQKQHTVTMSCGDVPKLFWKCFLRIIQYNFIEKQGTGLQREFTGTI